MPTAMNPAYVNPLMHWVSVLAVQLPLALSKPFIGKTGERRHKRIIPYHEIVIAGVDPGVLRGLTRELSS
jgi:hypothetical protein